MSKDRVWWHGDSSIYEAMKPLTNWFEKNYPYIEGQGNFGTESGDNPAASRYTEASLSDFAKDALCLKEVTKFHNIVDWVPTYDNKNVEPEYFPAALPVLLIQGAFGIGVGIKTQLPAHNLGEVIDATIKLMHNPNAKICLVPDMCMKGYIFDTDFQLISNKGHGTVTFRGIIDIEKRNGYDAVVLKTKPDMVYFDSILSKIEDMASKKEIQLHRFYEDDGYDDYGHKLTYYVYELKKGADPVYTRDLIYKRTDMENSVSISFESLDEDYRPVRFSYKSYLQAFIQFRMLTKFRIYYGRLQKDQTRLHEIEAYIIAWESGRIDEIINMIRHNKSADKTQIIEDLITMLNVTDLQAKYIATANISNLSEGYYLKLKQEYEDLQKDIQFCMEIVEDDNLILQDIEKELLEFKAKYNRPRNCTVIDANECSIPKGEFKIIITNNNFIKKLPKNIQGVGNLKGDTIKTIINVDNTKDILLFDDLGKVFRLPVHKIPVSDKSSNGIDIRLIIKNLTSNINKVMYLPDIENLSKDVNPYYLVAVTANGNIKKMELQDFLSIPLSGIICFKLDDDIIKDVNIVYDGLDIIVYSGGEALRIPMYDIPLQKRNTKGVKSINSDKVVDGFGILKPDSTHLIVVTNNGKVNKVNISALTNYGRNKEGNRVIKLTKGDSIFNIHVCNNTNTLHVVTANEKLDLVISDIQDGSSISTGNKLIPLKADVLIRTSIR